MCELEDEKEYYTLTKKVFDALAPIYNLVTLPLSWVRKKVVEFTDVGNHATVLDVATGTGQQAFAFAKRGYVVTGVDLTESMLDIARKHNTAGLVKFLAADATHLRFDDNSFDVSCISFALHDMPLTIREKVLQEMARVTKLEGAVVIVDYDLPGNKIGRSLIYRLVSLYEGDYYKQFIVSDLEGLFQKTGIKINKKYSVLKGAGKILIGTKNK